MASIQMPKRPKIWEVSIFLRFYACIELLVLKKTSEIAANCFFFSCEYQNESTVSLCLYFPWVKILYYSISLFICFIGNLLLLREDPRQIWNRWKHLWSGHPDSFEEISMVSACHQNVLEIKGHQSATFVCQIIKTMY